VNFTQCGGKKHCIIPLYAPNNTTQNAAFWREIKHWFVIHPRIKKPDVSGGDTNIVEDALDRLPSHPDNINAVDALDELKTYLGMMDGWRETYPTTCALLVS
jgi:hypothetical protein